MQALGFHRETLAATLLWAPLPRNWEMSGPPAPAPAQAGLRIPEHLLEHQAVLYTRARLPFALLRKTYTREVLAFPPPPEP